VESVSIPTAVDEILLLKSEFESKKDIRDYLRKWRERQSNDLDPVREPNVPNPPAASQPWVGNMLNDSREAYDDGSDRLRTNDEEISQFSYDAGEGDDLNAFLEPGDLVALSS
jgi:hypothetical protein